jgi:hypothetical protein
LSCGLSGSDEAGQPARSDYEYQRNGTAKRFLPPKQGGSSNGSNGITLQSMAVGSIWPSPNSAFSSQCLDRRIPDHQTLINEIAAWEEDRNANHAKADWQFTTPEARIRLKHLYPSI